MKKIDMAINAGLLTALVAFFLNLPEDGYLKFVDLRPIAETELAKVLDGNTQDCLTIPSQTRPVPMEQALNLEGKTGRQVMDELGNSFCQMKNNTLKYVTTSSRTLYVQINKSLDEPITYGFTPPATTSTAATTQAGRNPSRVPVQVPRRTQSETKSLEKR